MKKDKIVSIRQIHTRELACLLYMSEGYLANLDHAMAVNAVTMEAGDLAVIAAVRERAEANCGELRVLLQAMKD